MRSVIFLACLVCLLGCTHQKPDLAPTQIVDGKSIVIPPEFDVLPESAAGDQDE